MDTDTVQIRKMVEARLLLRALEDPGFHARLVADPRAAFEEEMGVSLPATAKVQVIEEAPGTVLLVVPKAPREEGELSDDDLESISGGLSYQDVSEALGNAWRRMKKALGGGEFQVSERVAVAGVRG